MPESKKRAQRYHSASSLRWILIALIIGVLILSLLAFISPVSQVGQEITPSPTAFQMTQTTFQMTQTAEVEASPPTPEEIGYTDGIIFMSTLLILILLMGTLREALHRKGR